MIKSLDIVKYRKLENLKLSMSPYINIISGTNGTCKSSLLHIISNAHQAVTKNCTWLRDKECLDIIKQINGMTNPKIESLTKGDKAYNDPANGVAGTLFTVDFFNHNPLEFRKHNSKISNRYAVKPYYRRGSDDKLPFCPIVYLGLARLYPFGEYSNAPYVKKGTQLYKNAFIEKDHRDLYKLISECNRKWVVTYDICPLAAELYKKYRSSYLDVTYSIQISKKAQEYIFFSDNLQLPNSILLRD